MSMEDATPKLLTYIHDARDDTPVEGLYDTPVESFYEDALPAEERPRYRLARAEQGLDGEVALLRLRLHAVLSTRLSTTEPGQDAAALTSMVLRIIDLLVKAVRARGSGSNSEQQELERALDEASLAVLQARTGSYLGTEE